MPRRLCSTDPVDAMLAQYGFSGPWSALPATGVANRIYATDRVVVRVATEHPEAVVDALTESVAAPVAYDVGIRTPRLVAFDNSGALMDGPWSIWERVHGETLGLFPLDVRERARTWNEVGREVARLHTFVRECPDPHHYLDTPGYSLDLEATLRRLVDSGAVASGLARDIEALIGELAPHVLEANAPRTFVHNDLHQMNIICRRDGGLLSLLDWGDAGWGDPTADFASVPLEMLASALEGYNDAGPNDLGRWPEARFVWARLDEALADAIENPGTPIPLKAYRTLLDSGAVAVSWRSA